MSTTKRASRRYQVLKITGVTVLFGAWLAQNWMQREYAAARQDIERAERMVSTLDFQASRLEGVAQAELAQACPDTTLTFSALNGFVVCGLEAARASHESAARVGHISDTGVVAELTLHVGNTNTILADVRRFERSSDLDSARWLLRRAITLRNEAWLPAYARFREGYRQVCREELRAARIYTSTYVIGMILMGLAALGGALPVLRGSIS
jgi:hypothetical protein